MNVNAAISTDGSTTFVTAIFWGDQLPAYFRDQDVIESNCKSTRVICGKSTLCCVWLLIQYVLDIMNIILHHIDE